MRTCATPAARRRAMTPHEALSLIFAQLKTRFDPVVLGAFIRMMGVYPPGSVVQLVDERFAIVVSVNSSRPLKPRVIVHEPGHRAARGADTGPGKHAQRGHTPQPQAGGGCRASRWTTCRRASALAISSNRPIRRWRRPPRDHRRPWPVDRRAAGGGVVGGWCQPAHRGGQPGRGRADGCARGRHAGAAGGGAQRHAAGPVLLGRRGRRAGDGHPFPKTLVRGADGGAGGRWSGASAR